MFRSFQSLLFCSFMMVSLAGVAVAGSQSLTGHKRWLAVASTQDIDAAKGIASNYAWQGAKIMSAAGGWYAVVLGPYEASSMAELKKKFEDRITDLKVQLKNHESNNEATEELKRKLADHVRESNKKYSDLLQSKLDMEDELKSKFDKEKKRMLADFEVRLKEEIDKV